MKIVKIPPSASIVYQFLVFLFLPKGEDKVDQLERPTQPATKFNLVDKAEPMSLLCHNVVCIKSYKKKRPQTELTGLSQSEAPSSYCI